MRQQWLDMCQELVLIKGDIYTHYRKIFAPYRRSFSLSDDLTLADSGYTSAKLGHLTRGYLHDESIKAAVWLWTRIREKGKYGSVGFTTYNHFMKSGKERRGNATMMGPCIQALNLTFIDKKTVRIDAFYRTSEAFKKFPADLVFIRDVLLKPFNLKDMKITELCCHFANMSITANYFMTIVPFLKDPVKLIDRVRVKDPVFFKVLIHWLNCLCCPDALYRIENHSQSMRVHMDVQKRVPKAMQREIATYVRKHRGKTKATRVGADDE